MKNKIEQVVERVLKVYESMRTAPQRQLGYQRMLAAVERNEPHLQPLALKRKK